MNESIEQIDRMRGPHTLTSATRVLVDEVAKQMFDGNYHDAMNAFVDRAENGYYNDNRLEALNRFWVLGRN